MSTCNKKIETPYFLISTHKAVSNLAKFKKAISTFNRTDLIAYSIKANYNEQIIDSFEKNESLFEVCSEYELSKLQEYDVGFNRIIINGFREDKENLLEYAYRGALVIIGSESDLKWISSIEHNVSIGIRINLDYIKTDNDLYACKYSRFGIDIRSSYLFESVIKNNNINIVCLHCHFSGNTRDPQIYADIVKELCEIINKYKLKQVKMIDIGGGYKVDPKFWSFYDYVRSTVSALKISNMEELKIVYEPGNSLVRNACSYFTKVIDVKKMHDVTYVTVDGTGLHLFPKGKYSLDYKLPEKKNSDVIKKQIVVGNTCKESDVILDLEDHRQLELGDIIQFDNLGAYLLNEISAFLLEYPSIYYDYGALK